VARADALQLFLRVEKAHARAEQLRGSASAVHGLDQVLPTPASYARTTAALTTSRVVIERLGPPAAESVPSDERPRVVVAFREPTYARDLSELLSDDLFVAGVTTDGAEAVALAIVEQPDVMVIDQVLPTLRGLEAARQIRQYAPACRIILLTGDPDIEAAANRADVDVCCGLASPTAIIDAIRSFRQIS
jgi:CheY-like chemotaxis protein